MFYDQSTYQVRLEWGRAGLENLAPAEATIIDVLSFSTSVDVAVSRGAAVYPYRWKDSRAAAFAAEQNAFLASARAEKGYSLSPTSLLEIEAGTRLVLPSPNGSSLSALAAETSNVFTACLRNAEVVAQHVTTSYKTVNLIPAGERWEDGSLRPAVED